MEAFKFNGTIEPVADDWLTENTKTLPYSRKGKELISRWKLSFKERLVILFGGFVEVSILAYQYPPISLSVKGRSRTNSND